MAEGSNGFHNIDPTTDLDIRNTVQTETEADHMPNNGSIEGCDNRHNSVGLTRKCENASHICDNENNIKSSGNELRSQESAYEDTNSSKSDCKNKTETSRSLQTLDKSVSDKEHKPNATSIACGINRESIVNVLCKSNNKTSICDKDTNVETNGNVLDLREGTVLNDKKPTSVDSVRQHRNETAKRRLSNSQILNSHGKEAERNNEQVGCYVPTESSENRFLENKDLSDMHIGSLSPDYQTETGKYNSSTYTDESWKESSETSRPCKSKFSGETKSKVNVNFLCDPQTLANQVAGSIDRKEGPASVIRNSANEGPDEETDCKIHGIDIDKEKHTTSRDLPESHITDHRDPSESLESTLYSRQMEVGNNNSCKLDTCNAASSARAVITQSHVTLSASGATEKTMRMKTSGNNEQCVTHEPKAIEQHSSEIRRNDDVNIEVRKEAATNPSEHVAGESSGIVDRDKILTIVSNRDEKQSNSKTPPRIIFEQESEQQVNLSRKKSKCVTSVSRNNEEEDRHNDVPGHGQQPSTSPGSHNMRSRTNYDLQGCTRHNKSTDFHVQNAPSNRKQRTSAEQENSNQSILTGERSQCVSASSRLQNGRQQAAGIPSLSGRNEESESGRVYNGRTTAHANTGQRQSKSVTGHRTTAEKENSSQNELAQNHSHRISPILNMVEYPHTSPYEPEHTIQLGSVRTRRTQNLHVGTGRSASRGQNEGGDDDGGDDDGGGQEANTRLFDCTGLDVSINSRTEFQPNNTVNNIQLGRLVLNTTDDDRIKRFFRIKHFPFLFKDQVSNSFVFHIGNRSIIQVIEVLNEIKDRLKQLCFARFFGTTVNGIEIADPNDLVIIFGFRVINGHLNNVPSIQMVV